MKLSVVDKYLNKVFLIDIMQLLKKLPDGSVDLIYGDPDYNIGVKQGHRLYAGLFEDYMRWNVELAKESYRVLKEDGNMFMLNFPKQNAHLRVRYLDEVCHEVLDYSWLYDNNVGQSSHHFMIAHRSILHCRKSAKSKFYRESVLAPYKCLYHPRVKRKLALGSKGKMPSDWFYFDIMRHGDAGKLNHPCQHPWQLSAMLIRSCTKEGDIVLILFGGSGTEVEVCVELNRCYIAAEINENYYKIILDRLKRRKSTNLWEQS